MLTVPDTKGPTAGMQAWVVDTFVDEQFQGNPACVIYLEAAFLPGPHMQAVAKSLDVPTTAFVIPHGPEQFHIRWFTPEKELNLCGHATIASAAYLYQVMGLCRARALQFLTAMGPLVAQYREGYIFLRLPRMGFTRCDPPHGLERALGAEIRFCGRAIDDILVELENEDCVATLAPDFDAMREIDCRGHIVTARSHRSGVDFVSRSFFPALGVNEDHVCVSAHCKLGPFWADKLVKSRLHALQLSPRGGRLIVNVEPDSVEVAGTATVRESRAHVSNCKT